MQKWLIGAVCALLCVGSASKAPQSTPTPTPEFPGMKSPVPPTTPDIVSPVPPDFVENRCGGAVAEAAIYAVASPPSPTLVKPKKIIAEDDKHIVQTDQYLRNLSPQEARELSGDDLIRWSEARIANAQSRSGLAALNRLLNTPVEQDPPSC